MIQPQHPVAEGFHLIQGMRTEQNGLAFFLHAADAVEGFAREFAIPYRQSLVYYENIRVDAGGHRESQAYVHAAGIGLDRLVDEIADAGKLDNLLEPRLDLLSEKVPGCGAIKTFSVPVNPG